MNKRLKAKKPSGSPKAKNESSVKDILLQVVGSFARNFFDQLQEGVMNKVNELLKEAKRTVTVTALVLLGIMFMFIGLANIIDMVIGVRGSGYLFIGFIVMFFGLFLNMLTKRS